MRRFINGKWTSRRAWGASSRRALSSYVRVWDENDKSVGGVLPLYDAGVGRGTLTTDKFKFYSTITVKVHNRKQNLDVYVTYLKNGEVVAEPVLSFDGSIPNDEAEFVLESDEPFDSAKISVEDDDGNPVGEVQLDVYALKQNSGANTGVTPPPSPFHP